MTQAWLFLVPCGVSIVEENAERVGVDVGEFEVRARRGVFLGKQLHQVTTRARQHVAVRTEVAATHLHHYVTQRVLWKQNKQEGQSTLC